MPGTTAPLVLGSSSPYRRELLTRLGLPFEVHSPDIDESAVPGETPRELALRLAAAKARAVAARFPTGLVIGCDQVAHIGSRVFGKPGTHENAVRQLSEMSAQSVTFESALSLLHAPSGRLQVDSVPTEITLRKLTAAEIDSYLRRDQPYGCAGSAKLESLGIALIERMRSDDPTAIIGLPLVRLCRMLAAEGIPVL